jgi:hypothetical protein
MNKARRRLRRNILDYRNRKLRQYRNQGLSKKAITEKVAANKYLAFCMTVK